MLCVWETWRICIVEVSAVETEALLADSSSDKGRKDGQKGNVRAHVAENRVLGACKRVTQATQNYKQQLQEGRVNDVTIQQLKEW
jgi:hypothetical protein